MPVMHIDTLLTFRSNKRTYKPIPCEKSYFNTYAKYQHNLAKKPQGKCASIFSLFKSNLSNHKWKQKDPCEEICERAQRVYEEQTCHIQIALPNPLDAYLECLEDPNFRVESCSDQLLNFQTSSKDIDSVASFVMDDQTSSLARQRPDLPPPSMFAMVYMANKMLTAINQQKLRNYKYQLEALEEQREKLRNEKIDQWKRQTDATKSAAPWSTGMAVFSWISCCLEVLSGIGMIAMGNVVGGSLLLAGGVIQLTSHIMMQTGGWEKVAELLPGNNPEEKKKLICWMQIGVAIFSMMLAGAGGAIVGTSGISSAMRTASSLSVSGLLVGQGIVTIGNGIYQSRIKDVHSELQRLNAALQKLEFRQEKFRDKVQGSMKFDKKCIDLLAQALRQRSHLESNVFKASEG